jgi:hypothetical protein
MDASLFSIEPIWMQEVKTYLETCQMPKILNLIQKQKFAKKAKPFFLKEGIMYIVGQDNICHNPTLAKCADETHTLKVGDLESSETPKNSELNCRSQKTLH